MNQATDPLKLYLRLAELDGAGVLDANHTSPYRARLLGDGRIRDDAVMSHVLELPGNQKDAVVQVDGDGDHGWLHPPERALTVSLWIYVTDAQYQQIEVVGFDPDYMLAPYADYEKEEFKLTWFCTFSDNTMWGSLSSQLREDGQINRGNSETNIAMDPGHWYHVAIVFSADGYMLYGHDTSGRLICGSGAGGILTAPTTYKPGARASQLLIRSIYAAGQRIAHLRVHHASLGEAELKALVSADLGGRFHTPPMRLRAGQRAPSNETSAALHPVHFSLTDEAGHHVLYIDDSAEERQLLLELHNASDRDIAFISLPSQRAAADNHHLELRFRPGTLAQNTINVLTGRDAATRILGEYANAWDLFVPPDTRTGDIVSIYLLRISDWRYEDGLIIPLHHMKAASEGGTRPTRVELRLGSLCYAGTMDEILCRRTTTLHVMWQPAIDNDSEASPLHVGLVGPASLLNDGRASNSLLLRVSNISDRDLQPRFELGIDVGDDDRPWTFCRENDLDRIAIDDVWPGMPEGHESGGGPKNGLERGSGRCVLRTPAPGLPAGKHLDIKLSNIVTDRDGNTNIYLRYSNIPGYRAGRIALSVPRSSMVQTRVRDPESGRERHWIGIGTTEPEADIHATGTIKSLDIKTNHINSRMVIAREFIGNLIDASGQVPPAKPASKANNDNTVKGLTIQASLDVKGFARCRELQIGNETEAIQRVASVENWVENDAVPTVSWVKQRFGWLAAAIGAVELSISYPDGCGPYTLDAAGNPTPPLSAYLIEGKTLLLLGSFYVTSDAEDIRRRRLCPRVNNLPKSALLRSNRPLQSTPGGWVLCPDGSIQPDQWKLPPDQVAGPRISLNSRIRILP